MVIPRSEILYPNFLNDPEEYEKAASLWLIRSMDLLTQEGQDGLWQIPWGQNTFADGNPIFSALCRSRYSGIRVLQLDPAEGEDEFTFWLDTFAKREPEQVHELVIACTLTQNTLNQSLDLMHQWVTRGQVITTK